MDTKGAWYKRLGEFVTGPKGQRWILILGFAGMALILLSQLWPRDTAASAQPSADTDAYTQRIETELTEIVSHIEGVGACRIMVTLENGMEYIYATQSVLVTEVLPTVKGVVIVCEGGDDPTVRERVQSAVMTALHITSRRVCVTKLS